LGQKSVVVICTRNRPHEVTFLVRYLNRVFQNLEIVVVEASDEDSRLKLDTIEKNVIVVSSDKGLPVQRNVAIRLVRTRMPSGTILHFIDDDVIPSANYFRSIEELLRAESNTPTLIASWDQLLRRSRLAKVLISVGLKGKSGQVGLAVLPTPPAPCGSKLVWAAGHGLSFIPSDSSSFDFNEEIEFFGEDLEATTRFARDYGRILCPPSASLLHVPAKRNGDLDVYDLEESRSRAQFAKRNLGMGRRVTLSLIFVAESILISMLWAMRVPRFTLSMAKGRLAQLRLIFDL
jgi:glycosyltransferase involved in cell wall biosynthesis